MSLAGNELRQSFVHIERISEQGEVKDAQFHFSRYAYGECNFLDDCSLRYQVSMEHLFFASLGSRNFSVVSASRIVPGVHWTCGLFTKP